MLRCVEQRRMKLLLKRVEIVTADISYTVLGPSVYRAANRT